MQSNMANVNNEAEAIIVYNNNMQNWSKLPFEIKAAS